VTTVAVPNLIQQNLDISRALLAEVGLQIGGMTNEETDAPAGTVIAQSPDAGTQVERGSLVNVVVSQARTTVWTAPLR
jgi:serine/threonine-protein kinase